MSFRPWCFPLFFGLFRREGVDCKGVRAAAMLLFLLSSLVLNAQTSPSPVPAATRDAPLYRVLFRQTLAYERLAAEADAAGNPKPYLRRILTNRLGLSEADTASLLRMAQGYQTEDAPLRQAIAKEKASIRSDFPLGFIPAGMHLRPSPVLDDLHAQEDSLVLRWRDLLQNAMAPDTFQAMVKKLYASFGQSQPE